MQYGFTQILSTCTLFQSHPLLLHSTYNHWLTVGVRANFAVTINRPVQSILFIFCRLKKNRGERSTTFEAALEPGLCDRKTEKARTSRSHCGFVQRPWARGHWGRNTDNTIRRWRQGRSTESCIKV